MESGEPVADLEVSHGELRGTTFGGREIVTMIDELPVLAVAATQAHGQTIIKDAGELRVKETDRIATTVSELRKLGAQIEPTAGRLDRQRADQACWAARSRATAIIAWPWR